VATVRSHARALTARTARIIVAIIEKASFVLVLAKIEDMVRCISEQLLKGLDVEPILPIALSNTIHMVIVLISLNPYKLAGQD
jgi:hypothetical protein